MSGSPVYHKGRLVGVHLGHRPGLLANVFLMLKAFEARLDRARQHVDESDPSRGYFHRDDVEYWMRRDTAVMAAIRGEEYERHDIDDEEAYFRLLAVRDAIDEGYFGDDMYIDYEDLESYVDIGSMPDATVETRKFVHNKFLSYLGRECLLPVPDPDSSVFQQASQNTQTQSVEASQTTKRLSQPSSVTLPEQSTGSPPEPLPPVSR